MRTFQLELSTTATVVVPNEFLSAMREMAVSEDASVFLKRMQEEHPEDDDAFLLAIVKNGFRLRVAEGLVHLCQTSGMGLKLAPAKVNGEAKIKRLPPPENATPVSPTDVEYVISN